MNDEDSAAEAICHVSTHSETFPLLMADALIAACAHSTVVSVRADSGGGVCVYGVQSEDCPMEIGPEAGVAVVARLAAIAGLKPVGRAEQLKRVRVRVADRAADIVFTLATFNTGVSMELRRLVRDEFSKSQGVESGKVGPYRLLSVLGRGGIAVVYKARHEALGREVALKVLRHNRRYRAEDSARFTREARAAGRIKHVSVVDVLDFDTLADGRAYLVMELVEHPTLRKVLRAGRLAPHRAIVVAQRIAVALDVLHRADIVHRDVKPDNIFLLPGDRIKLADFGAAMLLDTVRLTQSLDGRVFGTPWYMSPEQAKGTALDRTVDVYALGCILYEMVVGRAPFDAASPVRVIAQHLHAPRPKLPEFQAPWARKLEQIISKAMARRPEHRYADALELADDLERLRPNLPSQPPCPLRS